MDALPPSSPIRWTPDELRRFFRAFHKYGCDFYKVSKTVGGGKDPQMCAALWKRHQQYLSIDRNFQTEGGFVSAVQGDGRRPEPAALAAGRPVEDDDDGDDGAVEVAAPPEDDVERAASLGLSDDDEDHVRNQLPQREGASGMEKSYGGAAETSNGGIEDDQDNTEEDHSRNANEDDQETSLEADAAAAVVAMASPQRPSREGSLAATRSRRTPKQSAPASPAEQRTPASTSKRARHNEDIYEYYDEGTAAVTESARKRRGQKRLDFETYRAMPTKRRQAADERKGMEALLALAEVEGEDKEQGEGGHQAKLEVIDGSGEATEVESDDVAEDDAVEEEEDDVLGAHIDDDKDEDFSLRKAGRKTQYATPSKSRPKSRPNSAHVTPRRTVGRSPGGRGLTLGSPGWMGIGEQDFMGDFYGDQPMMLLNSPPGMGSQLPAAPSPQNPMPRLRRRKHPPEHPSALLTPLKSLFGRRAAMPGSAALSVLTEMNIPGVASVIDHGPGPHAPELEHRLRHCLNARTRRWAFFEFFYPAIDRSWFMEGGMDALAVHCGFPFGTRLTKHEWSALRSTLGRPRRLSTAFLREQRARLEAHRQASRSINAPGVSQDPAVLAVLPRPVPVGARVVARHPTTRALHDGSVLTLGPNNYRVQFDREELGVELVRDIDVMPVEPWECLPLSFLASKPRMILNGRLVLNGRPIIPPAPPQAHAQAPAVLPAVAQPRMNIPDPQILAELMAALDHREAIVSQLRLMNDEAAAGVHGDVNIAGSLNPALTQAYEELTRRLDEANADMKGKIEALEKSSTPSPAAVTELASSSLAASSSLPAKLRGAPVTTMALNEWVQEEAECVVKGCVDRMAAERSDGGADGEFIGDEITHGPLGGVIKGALRAMLVLQVGGDRVVPPGSVAASLDAALVAMKPKSAANAGLYAEVEHCIGQLKSAVKGHGV